MLATIWAARWAGSGFKRTDSHHKKARDDGDDKTNSYRSVRGWALCRFIIRERPGLFGQGTNPARRGEAAAS